MILDRKEFRLQIREYSRHVPSNHTWESYTFSKHLNTGAGMREQLKKEVPVEDVMVREMLDNVSHSLLYNNLEFRKAFRKRLIHYGLYYNKVL